MPLFIPPALMGIGATLARVGPAAAKGYRTLKGIRAARKAAGMPMGYQKALGTSGTGLGTGTSGTGLQGLMARGAKKFPGATGSTELGTGVLLGGEGVGDIVTGSREGDFGQIASGIGQLALGTPLAAKGLRLTGAQRTLKSKFPQTSAAMQSTGKEFGKRIPKGTTAVGLGGIGTGLVLGDEAPAEEKVLGEPIPFTVKDVLKLVEQDKKNLGKPAIIDGQEVIIGSPSYKKIAQMKLDEAYKNEQAAKTTPTATADQIAQTFTFDPNITGGAKRVDDSLQPQAPGTTGMDMEEIQDAARRQEENAEKGARIKKKMQNSKEADEFNAFYDRITNLTGGNDQTSNLLLMKFATGLMSGKTSRDGVRGFLDVAGQSGSGVTDTALALFSKEKDRRNNLAVAFLKAKEKQKGDGIYKASQDRKKVFIEDPNDPLGGRSIEIGRDKDTGLDLMFVPTPDGSGTQAVPMKYTDYTALDKQPGRLAKYRNQLNSISQGYDYAQDILSMPDGTFGLTGRTKIGLEKVSAVADDIFGFFGSENNLDKTKLDRQIIDSFNEDILDDKGNVLQPTEGQQAETKAVTKMYEDEVGGILKNAKIDKGDLDNLTKARLIETRMKYVLANANKTEDRLTRADVEDAAQRTQILGLTTGEDEVRSAYRNLAENLENQFRGIAKAYNFAGGNRDYIETFINMPLVEVMNAQKNNEIIKSNVLQNQQNILGTIE